MDAIDLIGLLTETTLAASAAVLLVLAFRRPLRKAFGPTVAYPLWLLVPAAIVAVLLPAPEVPAVSIELATSGIALRTPTAVPLESSVDDMAYLTALWLLGVAVMACSFMLQQRAFRASLGLLRRRDDGATQAEGVAGLPAVIGLWQPLIVVPADFDTRYTYGQRCLMQVHERMHIRYGDLHLNAVAAALRCVFWFNPLLHFAARHFRHDQELACDQRVIARHPHARREYGEAMLKTQLAAQPLPLGCHWAAFDKARNHPLKERIAMLKQPVPSLSRWVAGAAVVVTLLASAGIAAWATQPARELSAAPALSAGDVMTHMEVSIDGGKPQRFAMMSRAGESFSMRTDHHGQEWEMDATASPQHDGMITFASTLKRNGTVVGSPKLMVRSGEEAGIRIGETDAASGGFEGIELEMKLVAAAPPAPPAPAAAPAPPAPRLPAMFALAPTPAAPPAPSAPATNRMPAPAYPADALARRISGKVILVIDIDAQGIPVDVQVERSEPVGVFDQTAVDAAMKWRFTPAVENGRPVASRVRTPVEFRAPVAAKAPAAVQPR